MKRVAHVTLGLSLYPELATPEFEREWKSLARFELTIGEWWQNNGRGPLYILVEVDEPDGDYRSKASLIRGDMYVFVVIKADVFAREDPSATAINALQEAIGLVARRVRIQPLELDAASS